MEKSLASLTQSTLSQSQDTKREIKALNAQLTDIQNRLKVIEEKLK
jgi:hypothetical protein